jgi:hypothetical protein
MANMNHENVVRLYALSMGSQMMLISEFVPLGALISYLKKYKDALNASTMLSFSAQAASVSIFIDTIDYVHGMGTRPRNPLKINVARSSPRILWVALTLF